MNDVTQRFLRTIAERVPPHTVSEVRLFPAIRQGLWETGVAVVTAVPELEESAHERHTVYTARYRLAVKGPERGKWEFEMRADADAPLLTVDAVVTGVLERSGEAFEPERIPGSAFRVIISDEETSGS
jgi:hypothetical protein